MTICQSFKPFQPSGTVRWFFRNGTRKEDAKPLWNSNQDFQGYGMDHNFPAHGVKIPVVINSRQVILFHCRFRLVFIALINIWWSSVDPRQRQRKSNKIYCNSMYNSKRSPVVFSCIIGSSYQTTVFPENLHRQQTMINWSCRASDCFFPSFFVLIMLILFCVYNRVTTWFARVSVVCCLRGILYYWINGASAKAALL